MVGGGCYLKGLLRYCAQTNARVQFRCVDEENSNLLRLFPWRRHLAICLEVRTPSFSSLS